MCVAGSCTVLVDDGTNKETFVLDHPSVALLLPPMTWSTQTYDKPGTALLVLASHKNDEEGRVKDYNQFLQLKGLDAKDGSRSKVAPTVTSDMCSADAWYTKDQKALLVQALKQN